jgi:DhnA family fructose-bisphosphate aldolase class Ia
MKAITTLDQLVTSTKRANSLVEAEAIVKSINEASEAQPKALQIIFDANSFGLPQLAWSTVRKVQDLLDDDYTDAKSRFILKTDGVKQSTYTKRLVNSIVYNNLEAIAAAKKS